MMAGYASAQSASTLYYTKATGTLKAEIGTFVAMIDELETTGQPAPNAASFAFTDPAANTPLFDPVLASLRTVSGALQVQEACPVATTGQIALYAGNETISNDLTDTEATVNHLDAALGADGVTISVEGDQLVSQGLSPEPVSDDPIPAQAFVPTPERAAWIADVEWFAIQHTATQDPADDVTNLLLGLPTNAQQLAWSIWDHLFDTQQDEPDEIRVLKAEFGIYGALPVLEVTFDQGFILIDGLTGEAFGPYADGQPYDPIPLLSNHPEYQAGTPASLIVAETGCEAVAGPRWRPNPPPGYTPQPAQQVPCPPRTPPGTICYAQPGPYTPPVPPLQWPDPHYPYRLPEEGVPRPYPVPDVPGTTPLTTPWRTNPGVEGNPTDWSCKTKQGALGPVEFCTTITTSCAPAGTPCVTRIITCVFSNPNGTAPNKHGKPPVPGQDYPAGPLTIHPRQTNNPNKCLDRYFH